MGRVLAQKCLVKDCKNTKDQGLFKGDICAPCHTMITTGEVHLKNPTLIGDMMRALRRTKREWAKRRVTRALDPRDVELHEPWCAYRVDSNYHCSCEDPDDHTDECDTYKGGECDCLPWHDESWKPRV